MSKTMFIGDIHGDFPEYIRILERANAHPEVTKTVQVGDFGFGWFSDEEIQTITHYMNQFPDDMNHRFIRGNHDDPDVCKAQPNYIPDGTFDSESETMYVGGALSIDKEDRLAVGAKWWEGEELSIEELNRIVDQYEQNKPRIMVTHECPEEAFNHLFVPRKRMVKSRTQQALEAMLSIHRPEVWIFGHHHETQDEVVNGTRFICVDINQTVIL